MTHCIYGSDKCPLNPEPSDVQRAQWRRHHKAGTSPGMPKWYKASNPPAKAPFTIRPDPVYPKLPTGAEYRASNPRFRWKKAPIAAAKAAGDDVRAYCEAYDKAAGFKPAYRPEFTP